MKQMEKSLVVGFRADINRKALTDAQKKQLYEEFQKEKGPELVAARAELLKKHSCAPLPTLITPPLVHIPFFVLFTLGLRECTIPPTPFSYEEFFSATCLAKADPTGVFPVLIGITTLANLEISKRFFKKSGVAKTEPTRWERILENGLSMASVGMIVVAAQSPGAVTLYWMTSALYTMGQHVVLGILDNRRKVALPLPTVEQLPPNTEVPTAQRIIWATKRSRS